MSSSLFGLTLSLLLLVSSCQAGLVHRHSRAILPANVVAVPVILSEAVVSELRKDQIPVQVIELQEPEPVQSQSNVEVVAVVAEPVESVAKQIADLDALAANSETKLEQVAVIAEDIAQAIEAQVVSVVAEPVESVAKEIAASDALAPNSETESEKVAVIAEDIAQAIEAEQKLSAVAAVVEAESQTVEQIVQEEVKEAVQEENKELLRAVAEVEEAAQTAEVVAESVQQPAKQLIEDILIEAEENKEVLRAVAEVDVAAAVVPAESAIIPEDDKTPQLLLQESTQLTAEDPVPSERQATQATPTQTSTQTNFMQQLIQPIGQFFSQITGQQQPQQQQPTNQVAVNDGSNPGPTLPGFLNPSNAISSAQHAVQNVVNSTSQAFQGLQQIASNIGTSFQNTLSNLGGQQTQLSGSTTVRPPGPIQSFVNNIIGGNSQQSAAPPAQQGPLQGIISFFQGGNRPQAIVAAAVTPSEQLTEAIASNVDDKVGAVQASPEEAEVTNEVRNSEEVLNEEVVAPSSDEVSNEEPTSVEVVNEVPNSEEVANDVAADSELILVNDEAETPAVVA